MTESGSRITVILRQLQDADHPWDKPGLVEIRFFADNTPQQTADILGVSKSTVEKRWKMAKALLWLYLELDVSG